jgi:hypothetical protein
MKPTCALPSEITFTTDCPVYNVMKHVGGHWAIDRVVVDDENLDLGLKHMKAHTPGTPAPDHDPKLPVDDVEFPLDNPEVQGAHQALRESEWPPWEFGW